MSKSRREQKYTRLARKADKLIAIYAESADRFKSRQDPELERIVSQEMERRARLVLTPEVLEDMKLGYESLSRVGAELQAQNDRMLSWLRSQQEKEWKERYNRPLPGGILMRTKRLRKKRETVLSYSPSL